MKGYTTDGLYYRYENSALKQAIGGAECTDVATCLTAYYPPTTPSANWVGINTGTYNTTDPNQNLTYTPYLWLLSYQQPTSSAYYLQYNIVDSPMTVLTPTPAINLQPNQIQKVSSNDYSTVKNINDSGILYAGMYVGMGSLQLTGSSMYFYYGWYENNLAFNAPALLANFDQFVGDPLGRITDPTNMTGFLRDGVIAFEGAFWYWMYRSIGRDFDVTGLMYPSLHQLAVDVARPACHCVGAVTLMINGGCNDFNKRAAYANYFAGSNVLNLDTSQTQCIQTVTLKGKSVTINGAKCTFKDGTTTLDEATQNLLAYCQNP